MVCEYWRRLYSAMCFQRVKNFIQDVSTYLFERDSWWTVNESVDKKVCPQYSIYSVNCLVKKYLLFSIDIGIRGL